MIKQKTQFKIFFTSIVLFIFLLAFIFAIFVEQPTYLFRFSLFLFFVGTSIVLIKKSEFIAIPKFKNKNNLREALLLSLVSLLAALTTYGIANFNSLHLGPIIASSFVGCIGWILSKFMVNKLDAKTFALCVYCGSFVGMSSSKIMPDFLVVGTAGVICGIVFVLSKNIFVGVGGKLGTIAFVGSALTILLVSLLGIR